MPTLFDVIFASKARSTHHKLALDALRHVRLAEAERVRQWLLTQADSYLEGAKAPDDKFKDFKNHVLHVKDHYWGGALGASRQWYGNLVQELRKEDWADAAYCAGVCSHYFTDPFMPFHTGQSEAEGPVHRACEWSITRSYESLMTTLMAEEGGWPGVELPGGKDWLEAMICAGADRANESYQTLIDHYNLAAGVKNPPAGLDAVSRRRIAAMLGLASVGWGRVLERALADANVIPPANLTPMKGAFDALEAPREKLKAKQEDRQARVDVECIHHEFAATGKVIASLPQDDRTVRALHAREVLKVPLAELDRQPIKPPGSKFGRAELVRERVESVRMHGAHRPAAKEFVPSAVRPRVVAEAPATPAYRNEMFEKRIDPPHRTVEYELPAVAQVPRRDETQEPLLREVPQPRKIMPRIDLKNLKAADLVKKFGFTRRTKPTAGVAAEAVAGAVIDAVGAVAPEAKKLSLKRFVPSMPKGLPTSLKGIKNPFRRQPRAESPLVDEAPMKPAQKPESPKSVSPPSESKSKGLKFYLELDQPIERAPTIGPKMAQRLEKFGYASVADLLSLDAATAAKQLGMNQQGVTVIREWQDQARMVCEVPDLRGHDAQLLVGVGIKTASDLARQDEASLAKRVQDFAATSAGRRLLRNGEAPSASEVTHWIGVAKHARRV